VTSTDLFDVNDVLSGPDDGGDGPITLGYVEAQVASPAGLIVAGWIMLAGDEVVSIVWRTSDGQAGSAEVRDRPDVAAAFPVHGFAHRCGFRLELDVPRGVLTKLHVTATGRSGSTGHITQPLSPDLAQIATPPSELMYRVSHTVSEELFRASGLKMYVDFVSAFKRYDGWNVDEPLLDWGCGCGRIAAFFLHDQPRRRYYGCDVDPQGLDWIRRHSVGGIFAVIDPDPPTSYDDAMFGSVLSYSVLTHLDRATQQTWLAEIARILEPGGLFLASVHGEFAAFWTGMSVEHLAGAGILDHTLDHTLDGITPEGYYRSTYQSEGYTRRSFEPHFDVLEIVAGGAGSLQDLVIARRR